MKKNKICSLLVGILGSISCTATNYVYADSPLNLTATSLKTKKGEVSDQKLSVLSVLDQSGKKASWNSYKEFYTDSNGYRGIFSLTVPANISAASITDLAFVTNYRGPSRSEQRWYWQIKNFSNGKWEFLADNSDAPSWKWKIIRANIDENPARFLDSNNNIQLCYLTKNDEDDSDIDYLAMKVYYSTDNNNSDSTDNDIPDNNDTPVADDDTTNTDTPDNNTPVADDDTTNTDTPDNNTPNDNTTPWHPAPGTSWQIQITDIENFDTSYNVEMYDVDLFDTPQSIIDELHAQGKTVICYFNAGSYSDWRDDHNRYPEEIIGKSNGWEGEAWLDIRRIDLLGDILIDRMKIAVDKKCDGVDPDNVDGYANDTGFPLTYQDQIKFNTWIAEQAHALNLSVGLKNDLDQVKDLVKHFDWTVNEQCFQYNECDMLLPFIESGKAVFGIEYKGDPASICPETNDMGMDTLFKDLDLDAPRVDCKDY